MSLSSNSRRGRPHPTLSKGVASARHNRYLTSDMSDVTMEGDESRYQCNLQAGYRRNER